MVVIGGQHHRSQSLGTCAHDNIDIVEFGMLSANVIVGIDEHDVVVHHDPRQRDHTDTGQHWH